jgi:hypothetical protein
MNETKRINIELNKSSTYLLPALDLQINFEFLYLLRNTYLSFDGKDEYFCVLYEWNKAEEFTSWEGKLMEHTLFYDHIDYDKFVLYRFRLTKNMMDDKKLFVNGKYSLISKSTKDAIEKLLPRRGFTNVSKIRKILLRDDKLRDKMNESLGVKIDPNHELSSPPDMEKETFINHLEITKPIIEDFSD